MKVRDDIADTMQIVNRRISDDGMLKYTREGKIIEHADTNPIRSNTSFAYFIQFIFIRFFTKYKRTKIKPK